MRVIDCCVRFFWSNIKISTRHDSNKTTSRSLHLRPSQPHQGDARPDGGGLLQRVRHRRLLQHGGGEDGPARRDPRRVRRREHRLGRQRTQAKEIRPQ